MVIGWPRTTFSYIFSIINMRPTYKVKTWPQLIEKIMEKEVGVLVFVVYEGGVEIK